MVYEMCGISTAMSFSPRTTRKSRTMRDFLDLKKIKEQFEKFHLFQIGCDDIVCISTGDVATKEIASDLLTAVDRGREVFSTFIDRRLTKPVTESVFSTCPQLKLKSLKDLKSPQTDEQKFEGNQSCEYSPEVIGIDFIWKTGGFESGT